MVVAVLFTNEFLHRQCLPYLRGTVDIIQIPKLRYKDAVYMIRGRVGPVKLLQIRQQSVRAKIHFQLGAQAR